MAHIFVFNDWADFNPDHQGPQQSRHTFLDKGITHREMLTLSVSLAVVGTLTVAMVSIALVPVALMIITFGLAYSLPIRGLQGKGIPVYSSFLHFAGTLLTFLLGSMTFAPVDARALLLGSYFGILITAGHLVQEVQDYAGDRLSNNWTNAVRFGQKPVFIFAFVLFGFSFLFLFWLTQAGLFPNQVKYTVPLFLVYAVWAIRAYRAGLDRESVRRLRNQYRVLFAVVVLIMLVSTLVSKGG